MQVTWSGNCWTSCTQAALSSLPRRVLLLWQVRPAMLLPQGVELHSVPSQLLLPSSRLGTACGSWPMR